MIKVYNMFLRISNNKYYLIIFFNGFIQEYILNVVPCSTMSSSIFRSKKTPNLQHGTKERLVNNCHEYKLIANQKTF